MIGAQAHDFVVYLAKIIELCGVAIILGGIIFAAANFVWEGVRFGDWRLAYDECRSNLGRGILLGLELLVGADIISTITSPLTIESVGLLAGIIVIRTFLSFALETEIEGCWPWRRSTKGERSRYSTANRRFSRDGKDRLGKPQGPA
jgi:uncharacterized membrane protein